MAQSILGVNAKYITCPNLIHEVTVRHDKNGYSEQRMTVYYMVMDEQGVWYNAIGVFNHGDYPNWIEEHWQPTEWLAIELRGDL